MRMGLCRERRHGPIVFQYTETKTLSLCERKSEFMRAVMIDRYGGPEVLYIGEAEKPVPGAGDVLIRVACASINPADWKIREGMLPFTDQLGFPLIQGMDNAGIVEAVGERVTDFRPGDRVLSLSLMAFGKGGSFAEYLLCPEPRVAHLPANLSFAEGAAIPIACASASSTIVDACRVKAGEKVFFNGAAGGVGSFGVQFLSHLGAEVAATCSTRNVDYVRSLGVHRVIDYTCDDIATALRDWAPEGLNHVIDAVGPMTLPRDLPALVKPGGSIIVILNLQCGPEYFDLQLAQNRNVRVADNVSGAGITDHIWGQVMAFRQCLAAIAEGSVKIPPIQVFPMDQIAEAQRLVEGGHVRGKVVIEIDSALPRWP